MANKLSIPPDRHFIVNRLVKESVSHWGTVDVLVNNAGITRDTLVMRMKPEQWQSVIDTNLSAVFYASQVRWGALSCASAVANSMCWNSDTAVYSALLCNAICSFSVVFPHTFEQAHAVLLALFQ